MDGGLTAILGCCVRAKRSEHKNEPIVRSITILDAYRKYLMPYFADLL
jgi:hypothetical protein